MRPHGPPHGSPRARAGALLRCRRLTPQLRRACVRAGMLISAFQDAGLHLYNDAVFVRHIGSGARWMRRTYELGGAKLQPARAPHRMHLPHCLLG